MTLLVELTESQMVLEKPFCAGVAIFQRPLSFSSSVWATLLSLRSPSLSTLAWLPAFRSVLGTLRIPSPASFSLSVSVSATASSISFSCAAKYAV